MDRSKKKRRSYLIRKQLHNAVALLEVDAVATNRSQSHSFFCDSTTATEDIAEYSASSYTEYDDGQSEISDKAAESLLHVQENSSSSDSSVSSVIYNYNTPQENELDYTSKLRQWALEENISHKSLNKLLVLQREHNLTVPKDARSLLRTPRTVAMKKLGSGQFYYFGIKNTLLQLIEHNNLSIRKSFIFEITVNFDGLPLSKSSNSSFWPILIGFENFEPLKRVVAIVGLYHEESKLLHKGFTLQLQECFIKIVAVICDLPAKSFILRTKGHNGYFSCSKCLQEGDYINGVMSFTEVNCNKRTDLSFRKRSQEEHHIGFSLIEEIPDFDMIRNVPIDYMHCICLGIVKRILASKKFGIIFGKPPHKLPFRKVSMFSAAFVKINETLPLEFARKARVFNEVKRFKAVEFRLFILYAAPIIVRKHLQRSYSKLIMILHVIVTVLCSTRNIRKIDVVNYITDLSNRFITLAKNIFGYDFISQNVHLLTHIVDDVEFFGALDSFSAFKFENHMQFLKKIVRKADRPLQQAVKRISEINSLPNVSVNTSDSETLIIHNARLAKNSNFTLKTNQKDCYVLLYSGEIVKITEFCKTEHCFVAKKFEILSDVYKYPCRSSFLNIYKCEHLEENAVSYPISAVNLKLAIFREEHYCVAIPLAHIPCPK
ncbi:uncharacterized protein LOC116161619 isoform X2 [Photinus pyralis]|uniref:uncharacterized protein LOC116161440 isoform X2 n=1 Tax=Photinus pyralis TaxID=7054 RepID=UPI0012674AE5|nr:uncharacterized protein LOC116161440 isoform X2 [Photinus pyralis]XP_031330888.1 uncharacterized protein LOC116161619 isoform X2 [Photinus pyralis]